MNKIDVAGRPPPTSAAPTVLAVVMLVQAAGLVLGTVREGTALGSFLFIDLGWTEAASVAVERGLSLLALLSCLALVRAKHTWRMPLAAIASTCFLVIAIAEWSVGGAPFTDLAVFAQLTRIAAPWVYALWDRGEGALWLARVAVAATFATHGFEALRLHPQFIDYLLIADRRLLGAGIDQRQAELLLRGIGVQDILIAAVVLTGRAPRAVLAWAALWGAITACSRMVQGDLAAAHLTLVRAANAGLPLVLFLAPSLWTAGQASSSDGWSKFRRVRAAVALGAAAVLLAIALAPLNAAAQTLTTGKPGHLRLVWTEDPARQATISWSTTAAGTTHTVYVDTAPRGGDVGLYALKVDATENGAYQSGGPYYHHATVTGLTPDTTYYFVVASDGNVSPERHFITAHTDDRSFRLLYGGDSRSGVTDRRSMNALMAGMVEKDPGIVALAHGGDYINTADSWTEWNSWLEDHALTFTSAGRVVPIIPARGNHEGDGVMYNRIFGFPGGKQVDYWVTKLGQHVTFITLDSNVSLGGDQQTWLDQQLEAAQAGRWIIPSYHRPAYPAVKLPGGAKQFWVPLFEKHNVDVVCEADGHVLKRTVPIRNDKLDPTGIVYIGEGGLGVSQRTPINAWYLQSPGMAKSAHHVQLFSFSPEELRYEAILMNGVVDDTYTFKPRRTPAGPTPQPDPPTITAVVATSDTQVAVTYAVDMEPLTTAVPSAYQLSGDVSVTDVAAQDARTFVVTTSGLQRGTEYVLTVTGPTSTAGQALAAGTQVTFQSLPADPVQGVPDAGTGEPMAPGPVAAEEDPERLPSVKGGCAAAPGMAALAAAVWLWILRRRRATPR